MRETVKEAHLVEPLDVDKLSVHRYPFFKDAYVIDLQLDVEPDYIWQIFFEQEMKIALHLWERKIVIVGRTLKLITTPTKIGEKIEWLRKVIEKTNQRVREYNAAREEIKEGEKSIDEEALKTIKEELRWQLSRR